MRNITLVPAYGREYKSAKAVKADFDADKDFCDVNSGSYTNKADLKAAGIKSVIIRYARLTKLCVVKP